MTTAASVRARVYVVDDDPSVLRALGRLLRSHGYETDLFDSARAFLNRPPYEGPACLILDLRMPEISGVELQHIVADRRGGIPIIFLSGASDVPTTAHAMREGAVDFLVKPVDETLLMAALARAFEGSAERRHRRLAQGEAVTRLARLTKRERQVCELVARGLLNKQIASELGMAEKTVKVHRGRAMRKLEVDSVPALVRLLSQTERATPAAPEEPETS